MLKVIIAGSRDFDDYERLKEVCDKLIGDVSKDDIEIISGAAVGADKLGEKYANERGFEIKRFVPFWKMYGRTAGFIRNMQMAQYAVADKSDSSILIAFWDGKSNGTRNMIKNAERYGIDAHIIRYNCNSYDF